MQFLQPEKTLFPILPRVFGCTCFVQDRSPTRTKLDNKAIRCIFLGYSPMSKGYRCYDPITRHMYHSLDVTFLEDTPFFAGPQSGSVPSSTTISEDVNSLARPVPIFEHPLETSSNLPPVITTTPTQVYSRRPPAQTPLPISSTESGNTSTPLPSVSP